MEIPHIVQPRTDTGVFNSKLGIWLFLASEVMLFGALFSSFILIRVGSSVWPPVGTPELNLPIATFNTAVLISSSMTMILSWSSLMHKNFAKFKLYLGLTILLALTFLVAKSFEYYGKISHHYYPGTNIFLSLYFTMTFLHVLHVIGGMIPMIYFWLPGSKLWKKQPKHFTNRIETLGLYWHFVDLVWIFLFPTFYLL